MSLECGHEVATAEHVERLPGDGQKIHVMCQNGHCYHFAGRNTKENFFPATKCPEHSDALKITEICPPREEDCGEKFPKLQERYHEWVKARMVEVAAICWPGFKTAHAPKPKAVEIEKKEVPKSQDRCDICGLECVLEGANKYDPTKCHANATHFVDVPDEHKMHRVCGPCGAARPDGTYGPRVPAIWEYHTPLTAKTVVVGWCCESCKQNQIDFQAAICRCAGCAALRKT
jgi:hypothetical protein